MHRSDTFVHPQSLTGKSAAGPPLAFRGWSSSPSSCRSTTCSNTPPTPSEVFGERAADFEFILVDDCSTDETPAILERAAEDLRTSPSAVIRHETNGGLATARNTGLDAAQGEYLTFLDGDDWLAPGYFDRTGRRDRGVGLRLRAHRPCAVHRARPHRAPRPARPARRGAGPARGDPARRPLDLGRLRLRLGRRLPPPAASTGGCCTSPTGCAPPRTGRGSGSCTARPSPSPW